MLSPGPQQPYGPHTPAQLADLLSVPLERVHEWYQRGLPCGNDERCDPFVAVNWLQDGRLDQAPALAWRWRRYRSWFSKPGSRRTVTWQRQHRLYLPAGVEAISWQVPDCLPHRGQRPLSRDMLFVQPEGLTTVKDLAPGAGLAKPQHVGQLFALDCLDPQHAQTIVLQGEARLRLAPWSCPLEASERRELMAPILAMAEEFWYAYRRHQPQQQQHALIGTCLDCCLRYTTLTNRACSLVAGVIADASIANPHYWLEVETSNGQWCPVDPTLPILMHQLFNDALEDWCEPIGHFDARRIVLADSRQFLKDYPEQRLDAYPVPGQAEAMIDGQSYNAWSCQDWVLGETNAGFRLEG